MSIREFRIAVTGIAMMPVVALANYLSAPVFAASCDTGHACSYFPDNPNNPKSGTCQGGSPPSCKCADQQIQTTCNLS